MKIKIVKDKVKGKRNMERRRKGVSRTNIYAYLNIESVHKIKKEDK